MSRLEQYEAGALSAWTPASQAAMNATHHDKQLEHDQLPALEALKEEETAARRPVKKALERAKAKGDKKEMEKQEAEMEKLDAIWGPEVKRWDFEEDGQYQLKKKDEKLKEKRTAAYETAEAVNAGTVVDNLVRRSWRLVPTEGEWGAYGVTDHVVEPALVCVPRHSRSSAHYHHRLCRGAHLLLASRYARAPKAATDPTCRYRAPWYLRFLIYYPTIYFIPFWSAFNSLKDKKARLLWCVPRERSDRSLLMPQDCLLHAVGDDRVL